MEFGGIDPGNEQPLKMCHMSMMLLLNIGSGNDEENATLFSMIGCTARPGMSMMLQYGAGGTGCATQRLLPRLLATAEA